MVARPDYYLGCSADEAYFSGKKLFLLWQEIYLREQMGEIPEGSAHHFSVMVEDIKFLRPDEFLIRLYLWEVHGYRSGFEVPEVVANNSLVSLCGVFASTGRDDIRETLQTEKIKSDFKRLREIAMEKS